MTAWYFCQFPPVARPDSGGCRGAVLKTSAKKATWDAAASDALRPRRVACFIQNLIRLIAGNGLTHAVRVFPAQTLSFQQDRF